MHCAYYIFFGNKMDRLQILYYAVFFRNPGDILYYVIFLYVPTIENFCLQYC